MKVAVVDDDYSTLQLIEDYLNDYGHLATGFHDPGDLRKSADGFEAIIMDVMIGKDRTKGIRSVGDWINSGTMGPEKLVIFISNFGRETKEINDLLAQLKNSISFEWLDKNFLDTSFFNRLSSILEGQSK